MHRRGTAARRPTPTAERALGRSGPRFKLAPAAAELDRRAYEGEAQQQPAGADGRRSASCCWSPHLPADLDGGRRRRRRRSEPSSIATDARPAKAPRTVSRRQLPPPKPSPAPARRRLATQPLPRPVTAAFEREPDTVVLLFVHDGGIDDDLVTPAARPPAAACPASPPSSCPASRSPATPRSPRASASTGCRRWSCFGPKKLNHGVPTASVSYGFQSADSIEQAVIDAGYKGPTVEYHP